jgi:hypothetical protein
MSLASLEVMAQGTIERIPVEGELVPIGGKVAPRLIVSDKNHFDFPILSLFLILFITL